MSPDLGLVRGLEERAFNAWPAFETRLAGGWVLRFADGYTRRANSLNAWQPAISVDEALHFAAPQLAARGLPVVVRVSPLAGAEADARLAALGFVAADETLVMLAPLADHPDAPHAGALHIAPRPEASWLDGFADANGVAAGRRAVHDRIVAAIAAPAAFAHVVADGHSLGWGLAATERGMAGLFDIVTAPAARRRGVARHLVTGLLGWARGAGATAAYLQVVASNAPAIALYRALGFAEAYRYHYRITQQARGG